jgi:hypothetical protein
MSLIIVNNLLNKIDTDTIVPKITKNKPLVFLIIPLFLSAFMHMWNVGGFPDQTSDDGTYITRAMRVLKGFGTDPVPFYDHPYFGQLFLAGIFKVIGFPDSLHPQSTNLKDITHSIEMLYSTPRVVMGLLAIVDTFLIYKIAEYRYNKKVAFFASILFAVSPYSWLYRRTYLDILQAPFLLSSILFAVYPYIINYNKNGIKSSRNKNNQNENTANTTKSNTSGGNNKNILMIILSGVFLGLAIFTKIPAVTMIPMVGFLVYMNYRKSGIAELHPSKNNIAKKPRSHFITLFGSLSGFAQLKKLAVVGLWFIPVILIPAIWPASAISVGQFDIWLDAVTHQATGRQDSSLLNAFFDVSTIDPVLLLLGFAGIIYATIKKEFLFLLWIVPFLIFFYLVGHVTYNYTVPIWPAFCIAAAALIVELPNKIISQSKNKKVIQQILPFAVLSAIAAFGLVSTFTLISHDVTFTQVKAASFVAQKIMQEDKNSNNLTLISSGSYSWIFKYVFDVPYVFNNFYDVQPIAKKVIMITDGTFARFIRDDHGKKDDKLKAVYADTESIAKFKIKQKYDYKKYPNRNIQRSNIAFNVDVRSNY